MKIDVCLSPTLYPYYNESQDTVIIIDIFRATTTICTMFENGASSVIPVASVEEAKEYKNMGLIVGGERNAKKIDFADFGNSPFDYKREVVMGKDIAFTTTNGTQAVNVAKDCNQLYIGSFSNIDALVNRCIESSNNIVLLCSGWRNKINLEDTLFAGAFVHRLSQKVELKHQSDSVKLALQTWNTAKTNPIEYLKDSDHYKRLVDNGAEGDIEFCFEENTASVVPSYCKHENKLRID